ncbi:MAG: hypothetical protein Q7T74_06935 [Candidatus Saccharibacteria bacterium]|nr:hypothetical protein [Candidatus Saccharibacteria bacterium]
MPNKQPKKMHGSKFIRSHISEIQKLQANGYTLASIYEQLKEKGLTIKFSSFQQEMKIIGKEQKSSQGQAKIPTHIETEEQTNQPAQSGSDRKALAKILSGDQSYLDDVNLIAARRTNRFIKKEQS